jgi:acetate kinase
MKHLSTSDAISDHSGPLVLSLNGGSSSIKFSLFAAETGSSVLSSEAVPPRLILKGKLDRIGLPRTQLSWLFKGESHSTAVGSGNPHKVFIDWLTGQEWFPQVAAVGHRVVHGLHHKEPELVTISLIQGIKEIVPFDPEHLPQELALIEALLHRFPNLAQVVCFDTAFHQTMPEVARTLPLPKRFRDKGVERYGFHGISCAYLTEELQRLDPTVAQGKVVLAHLGNGASMTATVNGKSIDTTMSFTPTSGLVMGTRTGDLDPGLSYFLARTEGLTARAYERLVTEESGLLGISETSSDMADLLRDQAKDPRAAEAVELFCYQAKKWLGALAAAMGGLDAVVFAGGIGEHSPEIRARICDGLEFLGVDLSNALNDQGVGVISGPDTRVVVRVIPTNEEVMIARSVMRLVP